jgi:UDP-3-O-acyl-N-acetylglucosamine deacetylase
MQRIILRSEVIVQGRDFWGRNSQMRFEPGEKGSGWLWRTNGLLVPLNYSTVSRGTRQIQFELDGRFFHIYEHIGWLKYLGLMDVVIRTDPWPPYFGRGAEYFEAILSQISTTDEEIKWVTVGKDIRWSDGNSSLEVLPRGSKTLGLSVAVDYKGYGVEHQGLEFPNSQALRLVADAYTQGWPSYLYYLSLAASMFGWPHHGRIIWPQKHLASELVVMFAHHRFLDLLGALSLVSQDRLLSAQVFSVHCGHKGDLAMISRIVKSLKPLD